MRELIKQWRELSAEKEELGQWEASDAYRHCARQLEEEL